MTVANGDFTTQAVGGGVGEASQWSAVEVAASQRYAQFLRDPGDPSVTSQEKFEDGWVPPSAQDFVSAFVGIFTDLAAAFFNADTASEDAFEDGWGVTFESLPGTTPAVFTPGLGAEDAEAGWGATPVSAGDVTLEFASFGTAPLPVDAFESEWLGNESYLFTLPAPSFAQFTTAPASVASVEAFEGVLFDLTDVLADPTADTLTKVGHGLSLANVIRLRNENGRLPLGLQTDTDYLVFNVIGDTFQLRGTPTGAAVDMLDSGFGSHFIVHDAKSWWITAL